MVRTPSGPGVTGDDRVLVVEDERAGRVDQLGQPALDPPVALERPVPVEVVRGDVGVDRDRRPARQRRQLELGQLVDDAVVGRQLEESLDDRDPDVPAEDDRMVRIGRQQRGSQRRGRRLALGPGHPDGRGRAEPQEEVGLRDEGRDRRVAAGAGIDQRPERRAQARLGGRVVGRDRGRGGDQVGLRPGRRRIDRRPEGERHGPPTEGRDRIAQLVRRTAVVDRHSRAGIGQEAGQCQPAASQAEDRHGTVAECPGADRVERQAVEIDRRGRRHRRHRSRSTEARKSVTPSSAARMPTIQNRIVIFSSSQPPSSKW